MRQVSWLATPTIVVMGVHIDLIQVSWLATPTIVVMGVHIDLIRIRNHLLSVLVR